MVLDGARVVEVGSHDALIARGKQYAELCGIQVAAALIDGDARITCHPEERSDEGSLSPPGSFNNLGARAILRSPFATLRLPQDDARNNGRSLRSGSTSDGRRADLLQLRGSGAASAHALASPRGCSSETSSPPCPSLRPKPAVFTSDDALCGRGFGSRALRTSLVA